jgi:hypothetical protein
MLGLIRCELEVEGKWLSLGEAACRIDLFFLLHKIDTIANRHWWPSLIASNRRNGVHVSLCHHCVALVFIVSW